MALRGDVIYLASRTGVYFLTVRRLTVAQLNTSGACHFPLIISQSLLWPLYSVCRQINNIIATVICILKSC